MSGEVEPGLVDPVVGACRTGRRHGRRSLISRCPIMPPTTTQVVTKTSHSAMARHGWVALQRATRTVTGGEVARVCWDTGVPFGRRSDVTHHDAAPVASPEQESCAPNDGGVFSTVRTRGRASRWTRAERSLARRIRMLEWAIESIALSAVSLTLFVLAVLGVALMVVWVGIPLLIGALFAHPGAGRLPARPGREDARAPRSNRRTCACPTGNVLIRFRAMVSDPARLARRRLAAGRRHRRSDAGDHRDAGEPAGPDLLVAAAWGAMPAARSDRPGTARRRPSAAGCALRVQQLTESRAETVDTQAAELRRIERDLHDGAQARLVALGMSLAMAEDELDRDPAGARALLAEARGASSAALERTARSRPRHPSAGARRSRPGRGGPRRLPSPRRCA